MRTLLLPCALLLFLGGQSAAPTGGTIAGEVKVFKVGKRVSHENVWVYLEEVDRRAGAARPGKDLTATITQRNVKFDPAILVIPVGATVRFPNGDPIEHNVFSPASFDLGRYGTTKAGKTRKFLEAGEFAIYCDLHKDMAATVKAVPTRYFAKVDAKGGFQLANIPPGRYRVVAWAEASRDVKSDETIELAVGETEAIQPLHLQAGDPPRTHLNKNGDPYDVYPR